MSGSRRSLAYVLPRMLRVCAVRFRVAIWCLICPLGYGVGGEGDLSRVCECRLHRECRWFCHQDDIVGDLHGGVLLLVGEDVRAVWCLFEGRRGLGVCGLEFADGG